MSVRTLVFSNCKMRGRDEIASSPQRVFRLAFAIVEKVVLVCSKSCRRLSSVYQKSGDVSRECTGRCWSKRRVSSVDEDDDGDDDGKRRRDGVGERATYEREIL